MSQKKLPEVASSGPSGIIVAVLCALAISANYAARSVIPVVAHDRCPAASKICDATELVSTALSAFFAGDLLAQFSAGPLVRSVPGKSLLGLSTLAWALAMIAMPLALQGPRFMLLVAQAIFGFAAGLGYPSAHAVIADTEDSIDPKLRTLALSMVTSSAGLGSMLANYITPFAVSAISWVSPFFLFAGCGLCSSAAMTMSQGRSAEQKQQTNTGRHPLSIISDAKVWLQDSLVLSVAANMYLVGVPSFGLVAFVPTLFVERYGLELSELGVVTAVPPLAQVVVCFATGAISDRIIASKLLDKQGCRRFMQAIALAGPTLSLCLLVQAQSAVWAAVLVTTWLGTHSFHTAGCIALIHDVAKSRAGEFFVLGNAFSKLAALTAAPLIRLILRSFGWNAVIYLTALHYAMAAIILLPRMGYVERAAVLFAPGKKKD